MKEWSEIKLLEAFSRKGSSKEEATKYFLKKNIHLIPLIVKKVGISEQEALDQYTDAIIDMIDQVESGKFKGESKLSSYLYKIFYFKSIDLFRKNSTNKIKYQESLPEIKEINNQILKDLENDEKLKVVYKNLDQMGNPCKQILLDWGFWGYSMTEIASRVGLSNAKQAKDRKYLCLKKLRNLIDMSSVS